ncbi:HIR complex subunit [Serendipita sp. 407]|nr:HIR complex subunit [Serendipita sp. 407]
MSPVAEAKGLPKSLCTLTMHSGPVLVVRWASNGQWLASGSDDTIVMIWDRDPNGGGKVWGSDDVNIEGWKALRRLTGHESDVVDCAWSPSDRYLASVGLDSKIFIWCGYTLECVRRLDGHQGFVKGVCWDPVGEFLATQSDDKTVKIWRSTDWGLHASVSHPFEKSPGSAFFNRLSWSPDASYLCASNAMNNNGAVFVASVIERDTWNSNMSLVGHENTVQVVAYNPRLFKHDGSVPLPANSPAKRSVVSVSDLVEDEPPPDIVFSVVAVGADDHSISIWRSTDPRPLVVAKEAFDRQILDLNWSSDGRSVWACSSDGTLAVVDFNLPEGMAASGHGLARKGEMEGITSAEETKDYIKNFDFPWPPPLEANQMHRPSNGYAYPHQPQYSQGGYTSNSFHDPYSGRTSMPPPLQPAVGHAPPPINQAQKVTLTKSGKKRIQPTFLGGGSAVTTSSGLMPPPSSTPLHHSYNSTGSSATTPTGYVDHSRGGMEWALDGRTMNANHGGTPGRSSHSSSRSQGENGYQPQTYGYQIPSGSRVPGSGEARVLMPSANASPRRQSVHTSSPTGYSHVHGLDVPAVRSHVSAGVAGELVFEGRNSEEPNVPTEVICAHGPSILWVDYVPARVLTVVKTPLFYAAGLEDSSIIVYTLAGRR